MTNKKWMSLLGAAMLATTTARAPLDAPMQIEEEVGIRIRQIGSRRLGVAWPHEHLRGVDHGVPVDRGRPGNLRYAFRVRAGRGGGQHCCSQERHPLFIWHFSSFP